MVTSGQEVPNTDKPLHEDLYKKVMSGDPVAARLPNAILTKMVTFHGWKRFELNDIMKFHGVSEATFRSIMRRSLVINCKVRFVSAERLAQLPPGVQGYFLHKEDMKDFVTSSPAAGALFTIIMGHLSDFSVVAFREKLEKYADGGGDGGTYKGHHALRMRLARRRSSATGPRFLGRSFARATPCACLCCACRGRWSRICGIQAHSTRSPE